MISLGGQAPHVLRAHMWALNTCGEPNDIELTIRVLADYPTAPFPGHPQATFLLSMRYYDDRAVQFHPHGGQSDFVWLSARTPHGGALYVW